jgi:uncharacterized membrane protein YhaH (DUF805 family)
MPASDQVVANQTIEYLRYISSRRPSQPGGIALNAYIDGIARSFDFAGRSTRSQYWLFLLIFTVVAFTAAVLDQFVGTGSLAPDRPGLLATIAILAHLMPLWSVTVRRLHDIDRSGWWMLIGLVPLIGTIVQIVFACTPSTPGANRFGLEVGQQLREQVARGNPFAIPPQASARSSPARLTGEPPAPPTASPLDQLERLAALRAAGAIDDDEYQQLKKRVLRASGAPGR